MHQNQVKTRRRLQCSFDLLVFLNKAMLMGNAVWWRTFSDVPVHEGSLGVHQIELVIQTGPRLGDGGRVAQHADGTLHLGKVTAWRDKYTVTCSSTVMWIVLIHNSTNWTVTCGCVTWLFALWQKVWGHFSIDNNNRTEQNRIQCIYFDLSITSLSSYSNTWKFYRHACWI